MDKRLVASIARKPLVSAMPWLWYARASGGAALATIAKVAAAASRDVGQTPLGGTPRAWVTVFRTSQVRSPAWTDQSAEMNSAAPAGRRQRRRVGRPVSLP